MYIRFFLYLCRLNMSAKVDTYYFLGIGGIGMSALARYFAAQSYRVLGYDRTPSPLTKALEAEGIAIRYDDCIADMLALDKARTLVVRTAAIGEEDSRLAYFRSQGFTIQKRAELLGHVTREKRALCVAGTHGKTTTSTILAHILHGSQVGANAFLGGIANNYNSNVLLDKQSDYVVVEADEFDRSFHHLTPYMSVITSMDADHLDIYGTEEAYRASFAHYASLVQHALVVKKDIAHHLMAASSSRLYTYAVGEIADFYADNVRVSDGSIVFDFHTPDTLMADMQLGAPAWVNIENSVAAMAIAWLVGAQPAELREGLRSFAGVYRRFAVHVNTPKLSYIDDYAHHPAEIAATIDSVKRLYADRYVIGVFQPHLYSRTRDFAEGFAKVLSQLDELVLLPIYPARETPIAGVTSQRLGEMIDAAKKVHCIKNEELLPLLQQRTKEVDKACVVLTLGAGDIDRYVETIKNNL